MKRHRVAYCEIYNDVFYAPRRFERIESWLLHFRERPLPLILKHLTTLVTTQSIFERECAPVSFLEKETRILRIREHFACRKIQECAIRWLWKPGGVLFKRSCGDAFASLGKRVRS